MDIFCKIVNGEIPSNCIYEDDIVKVIMDVNPVSDGHCLVIPKKHYQDLYDIDDEVLSHILKIGRRVSKILMEKLDCDGISLDENNGSSQEVKHFHLHIIPRYKYEDITDTYEVKLEAMAIFESQLSVFPEARSIGAIEALAKYRGATVSVKAAEAFSLVREVK